MESVKIQVRFADIDVMGHVNNAVYLSYFEMARVLIFSKLLGADWDWNQYGVLLRKNEIEYLKPVTLNEQPIISLKTEKLGTKSFVLSYELKVNEEVRTTGSSVMVCFDASKNQTIEIPSKMREILESLV
jgi:acyl-CoA thioester hydrolase